MDKPFEGNRIAEDMRKDLELAQTKGTVLAKHLEIKDLQERLALAQLENVKLREALETAAEYLELARFETAWTLDMQINACKQALSTPLTH